MNVQALACIVLLVTGLFVLLISAEAAGPWRLWARVFAAVCVAPTFFILLIRAVAG